ncbi:hypothetical protein A2U01_0111485, partial [Trifolium medium]|nr:hypothetical protein [Trifolium medium]
MSSNTLTPDGIGVAHDDKWMMMLDMGFLVAQRYKHVVALIAGNK